MRVRTFTAASMPEAIKRVREELGPDAIIVSQRQNRPGGAVEVKAAVEVAVPAAAIGEAVAAIDVEARLQATLLERLRVPAPPPPPQVRGGFETERLAAALAFHRVPRDLAGRLGADAEMAGIPDVALALAAALDRTLRFDPLPSRPARHMMLVGPAGAGKTVTAAKLAARAALAGEKLPVVTTDTLRAGGVAQLETFTRLLGQPLPTAAGPEALARMLAGAPPTLIDTTGCNPFAPLDMADLRTLIEASGAEPVLVVPAGLDGGEAADIAAAFADAGVERAVPTRLDAVRRLGSLFALAGAGLALAQGSASPYVAEGFLPLSALALARLIAVESAHDPLPEPAAHVR